jgi:serine/threonine-protein kinase
VDSFVLRRDPVTNREYLAWLDALVAEGRGAEAERHAPRLSPNLVGQEGRPVYGRAADGRFLLVPDAEGDLWQPDWPVVLIDWASAMAFADWTAARTGLPWRLAWEPEREKALRGVDGRALPWGDQLEPTWSRNAQSGPWRPTPAPVGTPPEDESVYGVRGLAGNVRDWTLSLRDGAWAHVDADGLFTAPPLEQARRWEGWRLNLGGAWSSGPGLGRAGYRLAAPTDHRNALIGIRLARSMH